MTKFENESELRIRKLDSQVDTLAKQAAARVEAEVDPQFAVTQARLRKLWKTQGKPALDDFLAVRKEFGPFLEKASALNWDALERDGVSRVNRLEPTMNNIAAARQLLRLAIRQLEAIPYKIELITPADEDPSLHGCKRSDYILAEMNGVLHGAGEVRAKCEMLEFQLKQIEEAPRRRTAEPVPLQRPVMVESQEVPVETNFNVFGGDDNGN